MSNLKVFGFDKSLKPNPTTYPVRLSIDKCPIWNT